MKELWHRAWVVMRKWGNSSEMVRKIWRFLTFMLKRFYYLIKLFFLITNGSNIPVELKKLFFKKLFIPTNVYRDELFLLLNQRKINSYYDFFGIKICFPDVRLRDFVTGGFIEFLYPYLFGPDKFNPDAIEIESCYWDGRNMFIGKDDIVFDCGANIGLFSIIAAKEAVNGLVYAFEPFKENINFINKNLELNNISNVKAIENAVWEKSMTIKMRFDADSPASSGYLHVNKYENNIREITAISIDEFVTTHNVERVDFIKMDIEGAERYALKGAFKTIKKHKPKLSICTYHLPDDKEILPEIIKSIRPDYIIEMKRGKLYAY